MSSVHANQNTTTPVSNPFDVLNAEEEDVPNKRNPKDSDPIGFSEVNSGASGSNQESLWSHFKQATVNEGLSDDEDEVYMPNNIHGGGLMDGLEDDLDCYDDYSAQLSDLPPQEQEFCDRFDIHLKGSGRKYSCC